MPVKVFRDFLDRFNPKDMLEHFALNSSDKLKFGCNIGVKVAWNTVIPLFQQECVLKGRRYE